MRIFKLSKKKSFPWLFFAIVIVIAGLAGYRVLRLRFILNRINTAPDLPSEKTTTVHQTHLGLKAYKISRDGIDLIVFYKPLGFNQTQSFSSSAWRGEDMVYIATEVPIKDIRDQSLVFRKVFEKLLEELPEVAAEKGIYSLIPAGVRLKKINFIKYDGTLILDFDKKFSYGGGSLAMSQLRLTIEETARQFPEVQKVEVLVEGKEFSFEP